MADIHHNVVYDHDAQGREHPVSAVAFYKGKVYTAAPSHPNFSEIVAALEEGTIKDPRDIVELFDTAGSLAKGFARARNLTRRIAGKEDLRDVAERIKVTSHGQVLFDGKEIHGAISDTVLAYYRQGHRDFLPLIRFLDRVLKNPSEHSRENLYEWMKHLSFEIDDDGMIRAYKAVRIIEDWATIFVTEEEGEEPEEQWLTTRSLVSKTHGRGRVNGEEVHGALANDPGNVVEMDRSEVEWNPAVSCSRGLHVGTVSYAKGFRGGADALIEVKINPVDVISVPTDAYAEKMRVCKYEVVREVAEDERIATLNDDALVGASGDRGIPWR